MWIAWIHEFQQPWQRRGGWCSSCSLLPSNHWLGPSNSIHLAEDLLTVCSWTHNPLLLLPVAPQKANNRWERLAYVRAETVPRTRVSEWVSEWGVRSLVEQRTWYGTTPLQGRSYFSSNRTLFGATFMYRVLLVDRRYFIGISVMYIAIPYNYSKCLLSVNKKNSPVLPYNTGRIFPTRGNRFSLISRIAHYNY